MAGRLATNSLAVCGKAFDRGPGMDLLTDRATSPTQQLRPRLSGPSAAIS
jgi:hypothetical protein